MPSLHESRQLKLLLGVFKVKKVLESRLCVLKFVHLIASNISFRLGIFKRHRSF